MATLPTNFKDDILDTSVNTRRRYRMYENTDGTIELEDVTEYSQVGDEFGAGQINSTNTEVNKKFDKNMLVRDLDTINAITKEGYAPDALAFKELNDSLKKHLLWTNPKPTTNFSAQTINIDLAKYTHVLIEFARNDLAYYTTYSVRKGCKGNAMIGYCSTSFGLGSRSITCNDIGITFSDCTWVTANVSNGIGTSVTSNQTLIPLNIYGFNM